MDVIGVDEAAAERAESGVEGRSTAATGDHDAIGEAVSCPADVGGTTSGAGRIRRLRGSAGASPVEAPDRALRHAAHPEVQHCGRVHGDRGAGVAAQAAVGHRVGPPALGPPRLDDDLGDPGRHDERLDGAVRAVGAVVGEGASHLGDVGSAVARQRRRPGGDGPGGDGPGGDGPGGDGPGDRGPGDRGHDCGQSQLHGPTDRGSGSQSRVRIHGFLSPGHAVALVDTMVSGHRRRKRQACHFRTQG